MISLVKPPSTNISEFKRKYHYCLAEKVGGFWKWRQIEGWKSEKFAIFQMAITFLLFEVQRWLRYEKDSIFIELSEKQHRVTPKRNKRNKSNTLDCTRVTWPKSWKTKVVHSFTKLIWDGFQQGICIENPSNRSISKFSSDGFSNRRLEKKFFNIEFWWILAILKACFWPKMAYFAWKFSFRILSKLHFFYWEKMCFGLLF